MSWYIAVPYLGDTPVMIALESAQRIPLMGGGFTPEEALDSIDFDIEFMESLERNAERNGERLKVFITNTFNMEKVLYKP